MAVYGKFARVYLEEAIQSGKPLEEFQIKNADYPGLTIVNREIRNSCISRSHLDDACFDNSLFNGGIIEQSNLRRGRFCHATFRDFTISDSLLLHSSFEGASFYNSRIRNSMAQKIRFRNTLFYGGAILEVEARKGEIIESVFAGTAFRFEDTGGLSGFQNCEILNTLFYNCSFRGYVFPGADLAGSLFIRCNFDDIDWDDVNGSGSAFIQCRGVPSWFVSSLVMPRELEFSKPIILEEIRSQI